MSASTSNTKQKKVRYEAGTKGSSSHHRSSRDSGVGSSSASDRASLGTTPNPSSSAHPNHSFSSSQIETQRLNLRAVQEALDAANERIRHYEADTAQLNSLLSESNKENRLLKREKSELFVQVRELTEDLEAERERCERLRRGSTSSRQSPPRSSPRNSREIEELAAASFARESARRSSYQIPHPQQQQQQEMYPAAPQPPANPFLPSPRNSSSGVPVVNAYATSPSAVSYSTAPGPAYVVAHSHTSMPVRSRYEGSGSKSSSKSSGSKSGGSKSGSVVNDGKYHLSPL